MEPRRDVNEALDFIDGICSQLLESQLGNERSNLRDAMSLSFKLEYHIRGPGPRSVNRRVARDTLKLAKTEQQYGRNITGPVIIPQPTKTSSTTSSSVAPTSGPSRPRSRPSPPPPVSVGNAGRGMSTPAVDTMPLRVSVPHQRSQHRNTRDKRPRRGVPPMGGDVGVDMGYRTASTSDPRRARSSRVRDANRNVVWTEHYKSDNEGR